MHVPGIGPFRFLRLPFGLSLSQDVFQEHMDLLLKPLQGIINIADDIIVYGVDRESHDKNLLSLMKRAEEYGLVFNADKCQIGVAEITFFGLIYSAQGIKSDPERTKEIELIPPPKTVTAVRSFLGIANYMSPFVPLISNLLAPLRELTHKNVEFYWSNSHQETFDKIKQEICRKMTLAYFDTSLPTTIQVDASGTGIGAVLMQNIVTLPPILITFYTLATKMTRLTYSYDIQSSKVGHVIDDTSHKRYAIIGHIEMNYHATINLFIKAHQSWFPLNAYLI